MNHMMKTTLLALLLASAACGGGKKAATTPTGDKPAETGATGGAAYGGQTAPAAGKDAPNPCAPK